MQGDSRSVYRPLSFRVRSPAPSPPGTPPSPHPPSSPSQRRRVVARGGNFFYDDRFDSITNEGYQHSDERAQLQAVRMFPDPTFQRITEEAFPEAGVADAEEARVSPPTRRPGSVPLPTPRARPLPRAARPPPPPQALYEAGYKFLDVRSEFARQEGPFKGLPNNPVISVPMTKATKRWDSETQSRVYDYQEAPMDQWIARVKQLIPDPETRLIVVSADGRKYAMMALEELDNAGYRNIVGLKGGYYKWNMTWDPRRMARRVYQEYKENYMHGADSCGIHSSGAGFAKVDPLELMYELIH